MEQTVKEKIIGYLVERGMFESQAEQVLALAKPKIEVGGYQMSWDRPATDYPDAVYLVIYLILKREALAWIDEHLPLAWFRPMFCDDPQKEIARLEAEQDKLKKGEE